MSVKLTLCYVNVYETAKVVYDCYWQYNLAISV